MEWYLTSLDSKQLVWYSRPETKTSQESLLLTCYKAATLKGRGTTSWCTWVLAHGVKQYTWYVETHAIDLPISTAKEILQQNSQGWGWFSSNFHKGGVSKWITASSVMWKYGESSLILLDFTELLTSSWACVGGEVWPFLTLWRRRK